MPRMPRVSDVVVLRVLKRIGFYELRQQGSHIQLRHMINPSLRVTIAVHNQDILPKTLKSILKQASLTIEQFIELL